jgi:hypothetical protein
VHIILCLWAAETVWSSCWTCSPSEKAARIAMPTITQALPTTCQHTAYIGQKRSLVEESKLSPVPNMLQYVPIDMTDSHVINRKETRSLQAFSVAQMGLAQQNLPAW